MTYVSAELRRQVTESASDCCLSQEDYPFTFHMEHVISEKHGDETTLQNLALSCPTCNRFKGSDIAGADSKTGEAVFLFNPKLQDWHEHFNLNGIIIESSTPEGRLTIRLLQLNHPDRLESRKLLIEANRYPCEKNSV